MSIRRADRPGRPGLLAAVHLRAGNAAIRAANLLRPRLRLGVRLVALDASRRVLLVRHSYIPGLHLPGGAVDAGESCREAAEREAREEGGLTFDAPPELFHVYWQPDGDGRDHIVLFAAWNAREAQPKRPSLEIVAAGFHAVDRLPADVTAATRSRIDEVLSGRPRSDTW
jgi:ADP-ribose pyrophosphatase YjhB (NUDIX family)